VSPTIPSVVVSTDNGTEGFSWPDGGTSPFKGWKGMGTEGGFRVPCIIRWPGKVKPNQVIMGLCLGWTGSPHSLPLQATRATSRRT